jgi:hypothetical protein
MNDTPAGIITVGTRLRFDGGLWEVAEMTATGVVLHDVLGRLRQAGISHLLADPSTAYWTSRPRRPPCPRGVVHPHPRHRRPARPARAYVLGCGGLHRSDLRHGRPGAPARQAARHHRKAAVVPHGGARGRGGAVPGRHLRPGTAGRLGPNRGRRPVRRVPCRGLHDRAPRRAAPPAASAQPPTTPARTVPASCPHRDGEDEALLAAARRAAAEHHDQHGQPITRDALRARLGVSNQAASDLLRQFRAGQDRPPGAARAA